MSATSPAMHAPTLGALFGAPLGAAIGPHLAAADPALFASAGGLLGFVLVLVIRAVAAGMAGPRAAQALEAAVDGPKLAEAIEAQAEAMNGLAVEVKGMGRDVRRLHLAHLQLAAAVGGRGQRAPVWDEETGVDFDDGAGSTAGSPNGRAPSSKPTARRRPS